MSSSAEGARSRTVALLRPRTTGSGGGLRGHASANDDKAPPRGLLETAGAVRGCDKLARAGRLRLALLDGEVDPAGTRGAVSRALDLRPDAVVLEADRNTDPKALLEAGRQLGERKGVQPLRVALVDDNPETAALLLREGAADVVLRGDAEEPLPDVLGRAFDRDAAPDAPWKGVRGASWKVEDRIEHEPSAHRAPEPPTPAWDLVDLGRYSTPGRLGAVRRLLGRRAGTHTATLRTMRTCGPDCPTCHGSFGHATIDRTVQEVLREVRDLVTRRQVRHLRIEDEAFDSHPERAEEIARGIARIAAAPAVGAFRLEFPNGLRGDGLTPSLVDALKAAGLRRFVLRIGSGAPRLQRLLKRNIDLDRAAEALAHIDASGGIGHLRLMLGLPTETAGESARTIQWAASTDAHTATFRRGADHDLGVLWRRVKGDVFDDFTALRRRALREFYGSPRRAGRILRGAPRWLMPR